MNRFFLYSRFKRSSALPLFCLWNFKEILAPMWRTSGSSRQKFIDLHRLRFLPSSAHFSPPFVSIFSTPCMYRIPPIWYLWQTDIFLAKILPRNQTQSVNETNLKIWYWVGNVRLTRQIFFYDFRGQSHLKNMFMLAATLIFISQPIIF